MTACGAVLLLVLLSQLFVYLLALFEVCELLTLYIAAFVFYTFLEIVYEFAILFAVK
jgi:hypothetical protein